MAKIAQYYEPPGVPFDIPGTSDDVLAPWIQHRERLRGWFGALSEEDWSSPTRCPDWNVLDLAKHLLTVTHMFSFTVFKGTQGEVTRILEGFDTQSSPSKAMDMVKDLSAQRTLEALTSADKRFLNFLERLSEKEWHMPAEAPPGRVEIRGSLSHAIFDSWIHERDLLVPRGQAQVQDAKEIDVTARYILALAGSVLMGKLNGTPGPATRVNVEFSDLGLIYDVDATGDRVVIRSEAAQDAPSIRGAAADILDLACGRDPSGDVSGDEVAIESLKRLAGALAS